MDGQNIVRATEAAKPVVDALSVGTVVAAIIGYLPAVAAVFTIIWTGIRIWETKTVQGLVRKWRAK